ncbi:MAG TPA: glutamate-1-semialdehyde 2,1-aminomutase [Candidatus Bathyarchaeia archaeon]|nr:glutamate-1-semialdehyde 2,1-aminomutase [Candidatus Bathyarchaeia archaeon]HKM78406.1 glutamate-1-semialdehyde 2,1-aminomutase [Candidatus Bathyarchaeia archaeon]
MVDIVNEELMETLALEERDEPKLLGVIEPQSQRNQSTERSRLLNEEAAIYLPSGASSNVRVHLHEPYPILFKSGEGPRVTDVDGNSYVDYLMAYGSLILGHKHPRIIAEIQKQLEKGTMFGTTTELEIEVAKLVTNAVPCAEMITFSNTGTEATMEAVRIARAITGKDKIIKFEGHYHGHHDSVLFSVDSPSPVSGLETSPTKLPYYPGIPEGVSRSVIVAPWNNTISLERILKKHSGDVAAIITEPIMANQGIIPPEPDYLKQLRELTTKYDVLLIFDEVLTGFRVAKGGAQELYDVKPDLACYAKALGGGAPLAAVAGKKEIMSMIAPGRISFGGTYNANALSLSAAHATLQILLENDGEAFRKMTHMGAKLKQGLAEVFRESGYHVIINQVGPLLSIYFTKLRKVSTYRQAIQSDLEKYKRFRDEMLKHGVYMHPDGLERLLLSAVHTEDEVRETVAAAEKSLKALRTQTLL